MQKHTQTYIREEELKNRVATVYFGYWAEAKNHPADIYRMLAQLMLTIGRAASPRRPNHGTMALQFDVDADGSASRPYHE